MNKKTIITLILLFLIMVLVFLVSPGRTKKITQVCHGEYCFNVQLAETITERQRGLMNVSYLPEDEGMLFIFKEEGEHGFWMKDTLISLDIIWINSDYEIVAVAKNRQPCSEKLSCNIIEPEEKAKYVLEINGGLSGVMNLSAGDKLNLIQSH